MPDFPSGFQNDFPNISAQNSKQTSPASEKYNCIAWAYGISHIPMWPDPQCVTLGICYWPPEIPCKNSIEAFVDLFKSIGYVQCNDDSFEPGFEKIAIYADGAEPKHAARQLRNGKWTSKLGSNIDIEHDTPNCLTGPVYGNVVLFMKRKNQNRISPSPV
jgi:hypothetical protein